MGGIASASSGSFKPPENNYQNRQSRENIPSVFVDYDLLNYDGFNFETARTREVYEIRGKSYEDVDNECEVFEEFKLYASKISMKNEVVDTQPKKLDIEVESVYKGYFINSKVYLFRNDYNTIIKVIDGCMQCFVCDKTLLDEELDSHIETGAHQKNLDLFPPLEAFGLGIIRQRNEHSHCSVCNVVFQEEMCNEHIKGETHIKNVTTSIEIATTKNHYEEFRDAVEKNNFEEFRLSKKYAENKDNGNRNNDNVNKNNDSKNNNDSKIVKDTNENSVSKNFILDGLVCIKTEQRVYILENLNWNMISVSKSVKNDTFYCMACKVNDLTVNLAEHVNEISHKNNLDRFEINDVYEDLIRQDDKWSHCGTCNNIHFIDGTDLHIAQHKKKTQTYAESLRTISNPESKAKVKNNENIINDNRIENNDVPSTSANVAKTNGNLINDNIIENNDAPSTSANVAKTNDNRIENNGAPPTSANVEKSNENIVSDILKVVMNEKCVVFLYGFKVQVSILSLNVIFRNNSGFYCMICKLNFLVQYIYDHIKSPLHIYMLHSIPAVEPFGYNYIRSIDNLPHCGICHVIIQPNVLVFHLQDPMHVMMTNIALGIATPQPPIAVIAPYVKNDTQNVMYDNENTINTQNVNNYRQNIRNANENIENENNDVNVIDDRNTQNGNNNRQYIGNANENIKNENNDGNVINDRNITEELSNLRLRNDPIQTESTTFNNGNVINNILTKDMSNLRLSKEVQTEQIQTVNNENIFNDNDANILSKDKRNDANDTNVNNNNEMTVENIYTKINDLTLSEIELGDVSIHDILDLDVEVVLKWAYSQISWTSYNTLVAIGDGDRLCFLCGKRVILGQLVDHIRSDSHMRMISETIFVEEYSTSLMRKNSGLYHCGICNAIMTRSDLKDHIEWTIHDEQRKKCSIKINKRQRKTIDQEIIFPMRKESKCMSDKKPEIKIKMDVTVKDNIGKNNYEKDVMKNKIILLNGYDLKFTLNWEAWHSISCKKQKYTCLLCNEKLNEIYIDDHIVSEKHKSNLETPFLKIFFPSLLRQVSGNTVNCVICNSMLYDKDAITTHLRGSKHKCKYDYALSFRPENNSEDILIVDAWN